MTASQTLRSQEANAEGDRRFRWPPALDPAASGQVKFTFVSADRCSFSPSGSCAPTNRSRPGEGVIQTTPQLSRELNVFAAGTILTGRVRAVDPPEASPSSKREMSDIRALPADAGRHYNDGLGYFIHTERHL